MGFLGAIFGGDAPGLTQSENTAGSVTGSETGAGVSNLNNASNFWNTILSGNQQAISKLLAPEISNIQGQGQQQIQNQSQFGNRSGGTNATNQTNIDSQRQQVEQMIAGLTGQAASQVGNLGATQLGFGLDANQQRAGDAQQLLKNQQGSVLGQLLSGATGFGFDALTSMLGGGAGAAAGAGGAAAQDATFGGDLNASNGSFLNI
jgi:hypothetical protein